MAEIIADSEIDFEQYMRETDAQTKVRPASDFVASAKEIGRASCRERV